MPVFFFKAHLLLTLRLTANRSWELIIPRVGSQVISSVDQVTRDYTLTRRHMEGASPIWVSLKYVVSWIKIRDMYFFMRLLDFLRGKISIWRGSVFFSWNLYCQKYEK